ncbi:hypothetical protein NLI96_g11991 [Meripilus lineatus]|uniref:HMG box domain-containing protein n=1 Tax=Meripilus lineatus TaxID=2056292 RepID=A0AAD5Y7Z5_9APHY|nr:hypothetical protein NLI96_g11991 [Physisporinus lineatus]
MGGKAWKELSESQQAPYHAKFKQDMEEYRKAQKEYYEKVDESTIRAINKEKSKQGKRKIPTRNRVLGLPGKVLTPFIRFSMEYRKTHPTITREDMINVAKAAGEAWHKLTPEQKAEYSRPKA